jgi:hypothetical protein
MAESSRFNYAAPGARVGIQAEHVVITGGLKIGSRNDADAIQIGDAVLAGQDDEGDQDDEG